MNKEAGEKRSSSRTTAVFVALLLFYLPVTLSLFGHDEPHHSMLMPLTMATLSTFIYCINYFLLVPRLLISRRSTLYFLLTNLVIISAICVIIPVWFESQGVFPHPPGKEHGITLLGLFRFAIRDGVMMILSAGLAYAMRFSREYEHLQQRELELKAERRKIELQELKAQLNPHFLFNSLNNIYALIGFAPDRAQEALHDLSGMLRYMIYESSSPTVTLDKERVFILDYVRLMKLRMSELTQISCDMPDTPMFRELHITPLIYLTIVENAFKHFAPSGNRQFISLSLTTEGENLVFVARNSYAEPSDSAKETSGVGLENISRQLNLIYPDSHTFLWSKKDGLFTARIEIKLKSLRN